MAKFNYKMQNILDIKLKLEAQAKSAYAQAAAKLVEEEKKLAELFLRKKEYERQAKELLTGEINVNDIKICKNSIAAIKSMIRTQAMAVHVAEKNLELERQRLSEVMIERKTHEKLKENAFEDFKRELSYEENKEIDELISYTYGTDNE